MFIIILFVALVIIAWVSYYTSSSVYRSLVKKDNQYARGFQVVTFLLMFATLLFLGGYFFIANLAFQR